MSTASNKKTPIEPEAGEMLHCSFCDASQDQVETLIAGPAVFICSDCVELCAQVIAMQRAHVNPKELTDG